MDDPLRHHGDAELGPGLIDLAVNVRAEPMPDWLARAVAASITDLSAYPDPSAAKAAVAHRHGRGVDEVLLTAGAAQAFVLLARALRPRHAVVIHPQFTEPEAALRAAGHEVQRLILRPEDGFRLDPDLVPPGADLVVLGNPTNPTSVAHPAEVVARLARPGRVLVVDEAFADTVWTPGSRPEPVSLSARADLPGLVVVRSLTKTWGLAGLRVGYLLAPPDLIHQLERAAPLWSVSTPGLAAIQACASETARDAAVRIAQQLAVWRDHLVAGLAPLVSVTAPQSSFVLVSTPQAEQLRLRLRERGFAVRRCDTFPGLGPQWLRITVRDTATTDAFLSALAQSLSLESLRRPSAPNEPQRQERQRLERGAGMPQVVRAIGPLEPDAMASARERQGRLTKPAGSLGALEELSIRLAGLAGECPAPVPRRPAVAIFAGDHGVHAQGVSPWPQEVTAQMVANFQHDGAVVNAFAAQVGASVVVADVGVASPTSEPAPWRVRAGTRDLSVEPALTRAEARQAIEVGIAVAEELLDAGHDVLLTGDMGIANTTPAAALIAAFTGAAADEVTGRGTGIDDATLAHKTAIVARALALHQPDPSDPLGVLAAVGGLEHAALAGFILAAAAHRTPVILDGVIACSAALVARALAPHAAGAMVAGHRSAEPGASVALRHLGLQPLVDLGLRLGEGTGALLAFPILAGAARVLRDVATFDTAGVSEK